MSYDPHKHLKENVAAVYKWIGTLSLLHLKDERNWQDALSVDCLREIIWCAESADKIQARLTDQVVELATQLRIARAELDVLRKTASSSKERDNV